MGEREIKPKPIGELTSVPEGCEVKLVKGNVKRVFNVKEKTGTSDKIPKTDENPTGKWICYSQFLVIEDETGEIGVNHSCFDKKWVVTENDIGCSINIKNAEVSSYPKKDRDGKETGETGYSLSGFDMKAFINRDGPAKQTSPGTNGYDNLPSINGRARDHSITSQTILKAAGSILGGIFQNSSCPQDKEVIEGLINEVCNFLAAWQEKYLSRHLEADSQDLDKEVVKADKEAEVKEKTDRFTKGGDLGIDPDDIPY